MYWVVVVFGPHSGLVWTSTIVGWGGLIWLIGVIDVLTSTVTQLLMYLMQSNFRLLWNVKCTNASQYGEYMSVVHCALYNVHCTLISAVSWQQMWLESRIDGFCGSVHLWRCKFVLNMRCQQFGGYVTVEYVSWYLIYNANNWRMNVSCRVSVCPSGTELGSVHFYKISSCIGYRLPTIWGV